MVFIHQAEPSKRFKPNYELKKDSIRFGNTCEISVSHAAALCGKTPPTIRRWIKEGWPDEQKKFIQLHAQGRVIPSAWAGVRFKGNLIELKDGTYLSYDDLTEIRYREIVQQQRIKCLSNQVKKAESKHCVAKDQIRKLEKKIQNQ